MRQRYNIGKDSESQCFSGCPKRLYFNYEISKPGTPETDQAPNLKTRPPLKPPITMVLPALTPELIPPLPAPT